MASKEAPKKRTPFSVWLAIRDTHALDVYELGLINALLLRTNADGKFECFPSYRVLQLDTRISVRQLKRCVESLIEKGFIQRIVEPNSSNTYRILCQRIEELADAERLRTRRAKMRRRADDGEQDAQASEAAVISEDDDDDNCDYSDLSEEEQARLGIF